MSLTWCAASAAALAHKQPQLSLAGGCCLPGCVASSGCVRNTCTANAHVHDIHVLAVLLQVRLSWLVQAVQLCQLCCIAVASNSAAPDAVLDAAAARCLQLLTMPSAWGQSEGSPVKDKAGTAGCTGSQSAALEDNSQAEAAAMASSLLAALEAQPLPLLMAARRCTQQHILLSQQQQQPQQQAAAGGVNGITMTATGGLEKTDAGASPCQCESI